MRVIAVLDLLKLKTFLVVAATRSFTRAGAKLGYSQSSVTTHIQSLERELGVPLFDRFGRRVVLTEFGHQMLEHAGRLLAMAEETKDAVRKQGNLIGPLSVSAPEAVITYRLPEILRRFQAFYPHVHLSVASRSDSQTQIDEVLEGTQDMAVIVDGPVQSDQLTTSCPGTEEILIVKSPDYEFVAREPFNWQEFAAARVLLTTRDCAFRLLFERVLEAGQISLTDTMELGTIEAAKQCAIAGMGLAVLPRMALGPELKEKRLFSLPWPGTGFPVYLQMIRHRDRWVSPALDALWGLAEQGLAATG
ncbi:MAG TPA: LysR family transcriptional regulator [Bryobacteraceae bacterium]